LKGSGKENIDTSKLFKGWLFARIGTRNPKNFDVPPKVPSKGFPEHKSPIREYSKHVYPSSYVIPVLNALIMTVNKISIESIDIINKMQNCPHSLVLKNLFGTVGKTLPRMR
jgi:hypothetical protein